MKKTFSIFIGIFMVMVCNVFAQTYEQTNYASSSRFTDNWSVSFQGGVVTPFDAFFKNGSVSPMVVLGINKEVTPWLGFGVEGRTAIGVGNTYNTYTAFDAVNVSGNVRFNVLNLFRKYDGHRTLFEPIVYTGLGWGHSTASVSVPRNYMTYRVGSELNFNVGRDKVWAFMVNPSVVWGDISNFKLMKSHGKFELSVGFTYRFKNSNNTRSFAIAHLYDTKEVMELNKRIEELERRKPEVVTQVIVQKVETTNAIEQPKEYVVHFTYNSFELMESAKGMLNQVPENSTVVLDGYCSHEPRSNKEYNMTLSHKRANEVKKYLETRGVIVLETNGHGCDDEFGRVVVVKVQ